MTASFTSTQAQRHAGMQKVGILIGDSDEDRRTALRLGVEFKDVRLVMQLSSSHSDFY